jgi:hypothetical protein
MESGHWGGMVMVGPGCVEAVAVAVGVAVVITVVGSGVGTGVGTGVGAGCGESIEQPDENRNAIMSTREQTMTFPYIPKIRRESICTFLFRLLMCTSETNPEKTRQAGIL